MAEAIFYQYPKCSTCRRAKKWLDEKGVDYKSVDLTIDTPTKEELIQIMTNSGLEPRKFFNTSGKIYKERQLKNIVATLSIEEAAEMLSQEGMLIKRPLMLDKGAISIGFKEAEYNERFMEY